MESPLQHLRMLRAQYLRELERNELFVAWRHLEKAIENAERELAATTPSNETIGEVTVRFGRNAGTPTVQLAAYIIDRAGEPVRTEPLIEAMQCAGFQFRGSDPPNNLASVLGKSGIIKSVQIGPSKRDDRAWWFANRPLPAHINQGRLAELSKNGAAAILSGEDLTPVGRELQENKSPTVRGGA